MTVTAPSPMRFRDCERAARAYTARHPGAIVVNGLIRPSTPPETWHPRWAALDARFRATVGDRMAFVHYWVEVDGVIVDPVAAMFGYPPVTDYEKMAAGI